MVAATPSVIRNIALNILKKHVTGIRQSDLQILVEKTLLSKGYTFNKDHSVRNAIWNLQDKFPDLVDKHTVGNKAILLPKLELEEMIRELKTDYDTNSSKNASSSVFLRMAAFFIEFDGLMGNNKGLVSQLNQIIHSKDKEIEASIIASAIQLRSAINLMEGARDAYMTVYNDIHK